MPIAPWSGLRRRWTGVEAGKRQHRRHVPLCTREAWQRRGEAQGLTLALWNWWRVVDISRTS